MLCIEQTGEDVAARRRSLGISQARLATLAGCSRTSVALIEGGYLAQRSAVLPRILAVLNDDDPAGNRVEVQTEGVTAPDVKV